jgi:serine/threonine-protein phosphatase PP1 catalytic subunit
VWSDPCNEVEGWSDNERGTSVCFGPEIAREFLDKFDLDLICRAHQAVMEGWDFPFGPESQTVITLFSAPNYCYEYDNRGAIMNVDAQLYCSFTQFEPVPLQEPEPEITERPGTPPRAGSGPSSITSFTAGDDPKKESDGQPSEEVLD